MGEKGEDVRFPPLKWRVNLLASPAGCFPNEVVLQEQEPLSGSTNWPLITLNSLFTLINPYTVQRFNQFISRRFRRCSQNKIRANPRDLRKICVVDPSLRGWCDTRQ
jgi:hypothetical protein